MQDNNDKLKIRLLEKNLKESHQQIKVLFDDNKKKDELIKKQEVLIMELQKIKLNELAEKLSKIGYSYQGEIGSVNIVSEGGGFKTGNPKFPKSV